MVHGAGASVGRGLRRDLVWAGVPEFRVGHRGRGTIWLRRNWAEDAGEESFTRHGDASEKTLKVGPGSNIQLNGEELQGHWAYMNSFRQDGEEVTTCQVQWAKHTGA